MAEMRELAEIALNTAKKAGASYADIRITRNIDQTIQARDRIVTGGRDSETYGFGIRTIVNGTWGFASSPDVTPEEIAALAAAAAQIVALIGMPEGRITLSHAVIHLALAPKSNAAVVAINSALDDVHRGLAGPVPMSMRDAHYPGAARLEHGDGYTYSHDAPGGVATQQYAPDALLGRDYYQPGTHGAERALGERVQRLRAIIRGSEAEQP